MIVQKLNSDSSDHGSGRPIIYHPTTNTAYVGSPGGYHGGVQALMNEHKIGQEEQDPHHWRLGPDGLLDFYHDLNGTYALPQEIRQEAIEALGAKGEHKYDLKTKDTDWYFAKTASSPPTPPTPDDYWKAVTVDGHHHVFPGDGASHMDKLAELDKHPTQCQDFWGWNPYQNKWENFNRFKQDYNDMWDAQDDDWNFNKPTLSHEAKRDAERFMLDFTTPEPAIGVHQKGLKLRDGSTMFWPVEEESGGPHHSEIIQEAGMHSQGIAKYLEVGLDGIPYDVRDRADLDWDF